MKKTLITLSIVFLIISSGFKGPLASKYFTKTGHVWFVSEAPLERIEAHNNKALAILDIEKGKIEISILIKAFQFEKALMQEHFNENYLESDSYPKAKFSGEILNWNQDISNIKEAKEYTILGKIEIHGVEAPFKENVRLFYENNLLKAKGKFKLNLSEFKIKIPSIVEQKIADEVEVNVDLDMNPYL